jgi:signal transduction histidine kinase/ActR/RegA family two-component response regulator
MRLADTLRGVGACRVGVPAYARAVACVRGDMERERSRRELAYVSRSPVTAAQWRLALAIVILSAAAFVPAVPFARVPLIKLTAFIPSYESALALSDLITAILLFGQFARLRAAALLVLASGYLFDALIIVPHAFTFPGVFSATGMLGAGPQTTAWLYVFWHGGFPLFVLLYGVLGQRRDDRVRGSVGAVIAIAVAVVATLVVGLTVLATAGHDLLTVIIVNGDYSLLITKGVSPIVWLLSLLALAVIWRKREHSVLDLWVGVVLCAWLLDIAMSAVVGSSRYDLGWYAGRTYGLLAATFVLSVLLVETNALYGRLERSLDDLEDRHRALEQSTADLERSQEQLRHSQKMQAVGQLTGGVAHDFNNLLTAIIANVDLLDKLPGATPQHHVFAAAALRSASRGARLVKQLLAFGRRQMLRPEIADVNRLLAEFVPLLRRAVGERVEIELHQDPELWLCSVDAAQFESALLNLALNARDAMRNGGRLVIETRRATHELGVGGDLEWKPGNYVAISVTDTGTGMPTHVRERAFEPFFTTKAVGEGSGLGLSQVYGYVKQLGGNVTIDSIEDAGTTVTLYLPWAEASRVPPAAEPAREEPASSGQTVLVVEDDAEVRQGVVAALGDLGYRVIAAASGTEAIAILGGKQPLDLLFADVVMPHGVSGVEVAREALRVRKGIKVLLTSGYAPDVVVAEGADDRFPMLAKPYRRHDLADTVHRVLTDAPRAR